MKIHIKRNQIKNSEFKNIVSETKDSMNIWYIVRTFVNSTNVSPAKQLKKKNFNECVKQQNWRSRENGGVDCGAEMTGLQHGGRRTIGGSRIPLFLKAY
jgi:hypothetical protein